MVVHATTPTFVGRVAELAVLSAAVERASSGASATVLVCGDAGVGKSRLVQELIAAARRDGTLTLVGRCIDFADGELAYAPITGALRPLITVLDEAELGDALGAGRAELARLAPSLAAGGDELLAAPRDPLRHSLFELRPDPRVTCIDLDPFTRQELGVLVTAITGGPPNPTLLQRLYERSDGNAFFAQELLRAGDSDEVPLTVRDSLTEHLNQLSPAASRGRAGVGRGRAARRPSAAGAGGRPPAAGTVGRDP